MRKKRRSRYQWFPVNGRTDTPDTGGAYFGSAQRIAVGPIANNISTTPTMLAPVSVVPDFTSETGTGAVTINPQLADIVNGQAWLLKRLVGKIHLTCQGNNAASSAVSWNSVLVSAGFFVARAQDQAPAFCELSNFEADPQNRDNSMNPWIWRRTWLLRNPTTTQATALQDTSSPVSTMGYSGILDGGHIDSKVARRINREHRLWFTMNVQGGDATRIQVTGAQSTQPQVVGWLDLRVLGAMRRTRNVSSF